MMSVEQHTQPTSPSLLRRSTSIFRRLSSKRELRPILSRETSPPQPSSDLHNHQERRKLQRRPVSEIPISSTSKAVNLYPRFHHPHPFDPPTPTTPSIPKIKPRRRILPSDMRTSPFPAPIYLQTVPWTVQLNPLQAYSLVMGSAPRETEDQWFIHAEGPDRSGKLKVHFHRSWTGLKVAELFVLIDVKGDGAGRIVGIKWNKSEQTNGLEEEEVRYMVSNACLYTLGVDFGQGSVI